MASLQSNFSSVMISTSMSSSSRHRKQQITSTINLPKFRNTTTVSLADFTATRFVEEVALRQGYTRTVPSHIEKAQNFQKHERKAQDPIVIEKLYAIMEAVSDRIEMHKNIGEQRNNWNSLLLTSINTITLTASLMTAISGIAASVSNPIVELKLSSTMLCLAATGLLVIMNKLQPSQLVEEQRNASRLFKQIHEEIRTKVSIGNPNNYDVVEAMEKVLALDKAYPLPLLGKMIEKFPKKVESAVWWPEKRTKQGNENKNATKQNGWDHQLENEMREVVKVMKKNDKSDYMRLGEKALKLNKMLAITGPVLTGLASLGSASTGFSSWALMVGVLGGALASVVNTIQHGGQVGMVFEMYRSNAGFFDMMGDDVESSLEEKDLSRRENGELFEMRTALKLGRSLSELKGLATSSSIKGETLEEFACKFF